MELNILEWFHLWTVGTIIDSYTQRCAPFSLITQSGGRGGGGGGEQELLFSRGFGVQN